MNLESVAKFFSPKSPLPGAVAGGTAPDRLTITDVMASLGLLSARAGVGTELYLAKVGVMAPDKIINYLAAVAGRRARAHRQIQALDDAQRERFLSELARWVFHDYSLSAASLSECSCCAGTGFIDAEVFTNKARYAAGARPSQKPVTQSVRELVRVLCRQCNGKGAIRNECRCRGRGIVIDTKQTELQGVPVTKTCECCSGRGYPRLCDSEIYTALGIAKTTWARHYKQLFNELVEYCHVEESYAGQALQRVTK